MSTRARSTAAFGSGAAYPLVPLVPLFETIQVVLDVSGPDELFNGTGFGHLQRGRL